MTAPPRRRAEAGRDSGAARAAREVAQNQPVVRVAVDVSLPHLDRPFDYLVPESESAAAVPGVRVRVRFAGRLVDGFVLERVGASEHGGRLAMLERVVSSEVVLAPEIARLCRVVADRYAGSLADVLRLAVPPRHARVETAQVDSDGDLAGGRTGADASADRDDGVGADASAERDGGVGVDAGATRPGPDGAAEGWAAYHSGSAFLAALRDGRAPRAVWQALPGEDWPMRLAEAAQASAHGGRGALLLVPDARDLARLEAALAATFGCERFVVLSADLGPAERYRRFLAVSRGNARVVAGTRAAAFAPVARLGLVAMFDDGDDLYAEPRAPYPHAREVLALRSAGQQTAFLMGGFARTAEGQLIVKTGWANPVEAPRAQVRSRMPHIEAAGDEYAAQADSAAAHARLTPAAFGAARGALDAGTPVLVQVPRRGYLPGLACAQCARPARCRRCSGPLSLAANSRTPSCRWCGLAAPRWACPACASIRFKATVIGSARTAEEIGRAFPGARLVTSAAGAVHDRVPSAPLVVVATPGAEPLADGGYGAALLLDGRLMLGRADLRAGEETLRRWMRAATLVRPARAGGRVVVGTDLAARAVQWLIRWDPAGAAEAELAERSELAFPPAVAMAAVVGTETAVGGALADVHLPPSATVLGPVPIEGRVRVGGVGDDARTDDDRVRALIRVPLADRKHLAGALRVLVAERSARKVAEPLRIEVDPAELG